MGGRVTTKPAHARYETTLAALEQRLGAEASPKALAELAREFHMVGYSVGHDIPAMIARPELAARAAHGKLLANERAAEAYAGENNIKHALFHLFEGLETWPAGGDLERVVEQIAKLLDLQAPAAAAQLRQGLASLSDDEPARDELASVVHRVKYAFDWEKLPTS